MYLECPPNQQEYYDKFVRVNAVDALKICERTENQDNYDWDEARFGRVTGSVCYSLYTYSKNKQADWEKKLKAVFDPEFQGIQDTLTGLMYEDDAKSCYEKKYESNC